MDKTEQTTEQFFDLSLARYGIPYAKYMTKRLYDNIASKDAPSTDWSKFGPIGQFDRVLTFTALANGASSTLNLQMNNRNWFLLSRVAVATDATGAEASLANITAQCVLVPGMTVVDAQPISLQFGDGQWPHIMPFPEEWEANTTRNWTVTNSSGAIRTINLSFKFLQVRTF